MSSESLVNDVTERFLSEEERMQVKEIKDIEVDFIRLCQRIGKSRELSLAITKIEEAVFWSIKHVTGKG